MGICKKMLAFYLMATYVASIVVGQPVGAEGSVKDSVKFYVYTRQNQVKPEALEADVESVVRNVINPAKPTTLAIHGMRGDKNAEEYSIIKDIKLELEDGNVIIVDYSSLIDSEDFAAATTLVPSIADAVADLIVLLEDSFDLDLKQLHVVGFSLGGQISGIVGQKVQERAGGKIERITALDPAGILYTESTPEQERLSSDDAAFVEVVHTNAGGSGFLATCGHVDYYPNGGKVQPGCRKDDTHCSHIRAYQLIPEMWLPQENHELMLLKCSAMEYVSLDNCRWLNERMGDLQQPVMAGVYYVETNSRQPYGKGAFKTQFL